MFFRSEGYIRKFWTIWSILISIYGKSSALSCVSLNGGLNVACAAAVDYDFYLPTNYTQGMLLLRRLVLLRYIL